LGKKADFSSTFARLRAIELPDSLIVTAPEGFAYYGLDPVRYADVIRQFSQRPAFVVGIRSIGTVLAAVCAAALACERITVRPTGHPYDRELQLDSNQRTRIREARARDAEFFIVDEGPGLSGSSFLSTAEALERAGVARERITLIGSHGCDARSLVARGAAARWQRFRFLSAPSCPPPEGARPFRDWDWRRESPIQPHAWPATWSQLTPPKFISTDGKVLWKFEGLGRAGDQVRDRACRLAAAGFSPRVVSESHGFTGYSYVQGTPLGPADWIAQTAQRVAEYLTFRKTEFAAPTDPKIIFEMVSHNVAALLGVDLQGFTLDVVDPCVCDARLMPHEWIRMDDGRLIKADATMHGDDHFYPGACDIAWDIAGALIEWSLEAPASDRFLAIYEELSANAVRARIPQYKIAYSACRAAFAQMAAQSMPGTVEAGRFAADSKRYVSVLRREAQPFLKPKRVYSIA
jgi:hypothetical protein